MQEVIEAAREKIKSQQVPERSESSTKEIVLEAELEQAKITDLKEKIGYLKNHYTVSTLNEDVLKMESGLPTTVNSRLADTLLLRTLTIRTKFRSPSIEV